MTTLFMGGRTGSWLFVVCWPWWFTITLVHSVKQVNFLTFFFFFQIFRMKLFWKQVTRMRLSFWSTTSFICRFTSWFHFMSLTECSEYVPWLWNHHSNQTHSLQRPGQECLNQNCDLCSMPYKNNILRREIAYAI